MKNVAFFDEDGLVLACRRETVPAVGTYMGTERPMYNRSVVADLGVRTLYCCPSPEGEEYRAVMLG